MDHQAHHPQTIAVATPVEARRRPIRRRGFWEQARRHKWSYIFIAPFYILFLLFGVFPPLFSLYISFFRWDILQDKQFVGLGNYAIILNDTLFWKAFTNCILFVCMATVPMLLLALVIAFLLDTFVRVYQNIFLAMYFSPVVTSSIAVTIIFSLIYGTQFGLLNAVLRQFGMEPVRWLNEPTPMRIALALLLTWKYLGWNVVILLIGMQSISSEYYEAARIDGANGRHLFTRITIPLIRPTILYTTILSTIGMLQLFAEPYLLTGGRAAGGMGGRDNALLTMTMYTYQNAFGYFRFGYAAAVSYIMFAIILLASLINFRFIKPAE